MCRILFAMLCIAALAPCVRGDDNWPQFRGPQWNGIASGKDLPTQWSTSKNVAWDMEIPGYAWSSPIVWGNDVFVTTCVGPEKVVAPRKGFYAPLKVEKLRGDHRWMVYCLDKATGKIRWKSVAYKGPPQHSIHVKASYASETPITDGERIYAYFGNVGLFCFDMDGKQLWSKKWAVVPTRLGWGTGASPILYKDRIYLVNDNEKQSFLTALDAKTGKEIWKVNRDEKSSWATPFIWENNQRTEIVTTATNKVRSYDLTGKLLWEIRNMSSICVPTPVAAHGLLFLNSGYEFGRHRPVYAVRPGATGDISLKKGETSNKYIAWHKPQAGSYHPSSLVHGDYFYVLYSRGLLSCFDARTGKEVYDRKRLEGFFSSSPWIQDGNICCLNEDGETFVVKAGPKFEILARNPLEEMCMATPAVSGDRLFIRTLTKVYCLRQPQ